MKKGYLYIALATFFFSTMEIALKLSAGNFNAIQLTFLRFLIGGFVLLPLAAHELKKKKLHLGRSEFAFFFLTGFICVVVSMILFQMSVIYAPASVVAVLFSCNSVFVVMFAYLFLREPIHKHTVISILVSLVGMAVIINPLHFTGSAVGFICVLGAAITFALYNVVGRTRSDRCGGITLTCGSFLCGCAEMLVLIAISHVPAVALKMKEAGLAVFSEIPVFSAISFPGLVGLLYVGICVTGLGYTFYFLAMEATSAATTSLVFYIKPILAPVFALILLHEAISGRMLIGIAFILVGSLIAFIPGIRLAKGNDLKEDLREIETEFEAETEETVIKP